MWIKDLNIRPETIKFLGENIGNMLFDISLNNIFAYISSGKETKTKRNKRNYIKHYVLMTNVYGKKAEELVLTVFVFLVPLNSPKS